MIRSLSLWHRPRLGLAVLPLPYCPHHTQEDVDSNVDGSNGLDSEGICQRDTSALMTVQRYGRDIIGTYLYSAAVLFPFCCQHSTSGSPLYSP